MGLGEMCAGDQHRARRPDESLVDIAFVEGVVGAVVAIENQRERVFVLDSEQHQRRQAFGVGDDALGLNAFAIELLADEAAHLLIADASDER
ncbi:hypothetical protein FQZ97_1151420 [compost metagenome]